MLPVETPFKVYTGIDGLPLNNGYVYFGTANANPITAPVAVFWDAAGTQPVAQPVRTVNGYIYRAGTPANVFYSGDYSILVKDSTGRQVFYARTSADFSIATFVNNFLISIASTAGASLMGFLQAGFGAILRTVQDVLRERISVKDFGAVCDGVTDDRAAVVLALTAAGKRALLFPGITHIATALTITAPIANTGAQIFSATSLVTIDNGRNVKAAWFGAKPDGATESSVPTGRALMAAKNTPVELDSGTYRWDAGITIKGNATDGYQKLIGPSTKACLIECYGSVAGIQSDQAALAENVELSGFTLRKVGSLGTQIGLDLGTIRSSTVKNIGVEEFQIGLALRKNIDAIGNYYNYIKNVSVGAAGTPAGSVGFKIGSDPAEYLPSVHTNTEGNANSLEGCIVAGMETGLWIYGTGNTAKAMKIIGCDDGVTISAGFDNRVQAYIESQTGQSMGSAVAGADGNYLDFFNDALNCTPFVDSAWNFITGNMQAGSLGYPAPHRALDCSVLDHISFTGVGVAVPIFSVKIPEVNGAIRVTATLAGFTFTINNWAGIQQWNVYKTASGTPTIGAVTTTGDNKFTVAAAADGTVTWSIAGDAVQFTTVQVAVQIQGVAALVNGLGSKIIYTRLV